MTSIPDPNQDPTPPAIPAPDSVTTDDAVAVGAVSAPVTDAGAPASAVESVLDEGTFATLREPRGTARLALDDGRWHQISPKYVWVQLISTGAIVLLVLAAALVLSLVLGQAWVWVPGGIALIVLLWTMAITPRQARAYGYRLRADDIVFRRGILWQRLVAVPYGRMQLVDITHGPLDRGFGIAQLKLVTAAAMTGATIPGLPQTGAEHLRDLLIEVAETRRTGL